MILDESDHKCKCFEGLYKDLLNNECLKCHLFCSLCSGP